MVAEQTKPPLRRVYATDFEVVADGITYRPHASEWVDFTQNLSVGELIAALSVNDLDLSDEASVRQAFSAAMAQLTARVAGWNWTDQVGRPLPQPPEGLERLDTAEIQWLQAAAIGKRGTSGDPNAGSPSTSPSMDEREGATRGSGTSPRSARNSTARPKRR
jgi:hypothetical protein